MGLRIETILNELAVPLSMRLVGGRAGLSREIEVPDLNRPGLALSGFLDYFPADRLQVMGKTEVTFWNTLKAGVRVERLREIVARRKPAGFVMSHGMEAPRDLLDACEKAGVAVLGTTVPTTKTVSELTLYLEEKLAPSVTIHASLVDVFGVGILLMGDSGIGKSECALALVDKGHRLTADDVVEVRRTPDKSLMGAGVRQLRHHMEIRGLGIVDIHNLFGARAVRGNKLVDMVIMLVPWEPGMTYDRTGLEEKTHTILDVAVPMHVLPVKPGRNLAVLVETAAMNWRLKQMGVNSAERLNEQIMRELKRGAPPTPRHKRGEEG